MRLSQRKGLLRRRKSGKSATSTGVPRLMGKPASASGTYPTPFCSSFTIHWENKMFRSYTKFALVLATAIVPLATALTASAQGVPRAASTAVPAKENAQQDRLEPLLVVFWAEVAGGVAGVLGVDERPRFRSFVVEQRRPSYTYSHDVVVGAELPGGWSYLLRCSARVWSPRIPLHGQ